MTRRQQMHRVVDLPGSQNTAHSDLNCVCYFTCWNVIPTMITEPPLFLISRYAPLDLQVSRRLHRTVVEVTAGTRPLTQVAAGEGITSFELQQKHFFKA